MEREIPRVTKVVLSFPPSPPTRIVHGVNLARESTDAGTCHGNKPEHGAGTFGASCEEAE